MPSKKDSNKKIRTALSTFDKIQKQLPKVPKKGEEFRDGVATTSASIMKTIENKDFCTDRQLRALDNMLQGLKKWTKKKAGTKKARNTDVPFSDLL